MDTGWHEENWWAEEYDEEDEEETQGDTLSGNKNSYYEYKTAHAVKNDFAMGIPLSGVWMNNGTGLLVLENGKSVKIQLEKNTGRNINGQWYHQWNLVDGVCDSNKTTRVIPCLFLQERTEDISGKCENLYTVIRKDWNMIGENGRCERFGNI